MLALDDFTDITLCYRHGHPTHPQPRRPSRRASPAAGEAQGRVRRRGGPPTPDGGDPAHAAGLRGGGRGHAGATAPQQDACRRPHPRGPEPLSRHRGVREQTAGYGPVVVDASVAVQWFAREAGSEAAARLVEGDQPLIAPDIMPLEVANALWKKTRRGDVPPGDLQPAVTRLLASDIDIGPDRVPAGTGRPSCRRDRSSCL